jgi:hypothetical protein
MGNLIFLYHKFSFPGLVLQSAKNEPERFLFKDFEILGWVIRLGKA